MSQITDTSALSKRLIGYVRRAWAQLYWEQYAPVFALALAIIAVFLIGAFGGIWERIGDPWRLIALLVAIVFLARAFWAARQKTRPNLPRAAALNRTQGPSIARSMSWMIALQSAKTSGRFIISKLKIPLRP